MGDYMAHVFIVDDKSFQTHLKYMFAGTGAKDYTNAYLYDDRKEKAERLLNGMNADISRLRPGDKVIFYLQQNDKHEGLFFGSFKVSSNPYSSNGIYLMEELGKRLIFRVPIEQDEVYPYGITERECLDYIDDIEKPYQMCWSLIYRKLKANRGCTMITDYEYNSIMKKIKSKNANQIIEGKYTYDSTNMKIEVTDVSSILNEEYGSLKIKKRLLHQKMTNHAYESHLQAYILQNLESINVLTNNKPISWIGNEVSCGVGMQSIDIAFIQEEPEIITINVCELKDEQPQPYIKDQIFKYIKWLEQYVIPNYNKKVAIQPVIVTPELKQRSKEMLKGLNVDFYKNENNLKIEKTKFISFVIEEDNLIFKEEVI